MPKSRQPEYKTAGYLIPDVIDPDECICVCVPIPNDERHIQAFKAQLFALSRWWTWERDSLKRGKEAAAVWAGIYECVEARMDNNCGCGGQVAPEPMIRFAPDGTLEASYDGGQTWQAAPQLDPRLTSSQFPPLAGADGDEKRCNAAWAAAKVIEDDIIQKFAEAEVGISIVAVIAAAIAIYLSAGALAPLVVSLVGAAMQAGSAAIQAAFTAQVWEDFRCILYCNMGDDASISVTQWQQIKANIDTDFTGVTKTLLYGTVDAFGAVGLTNAARSNRASGAGCETCDCEDTWCYVWNFPTGGDGEWSKVTEATYNFGEYVLGSGWEATDSIVTAGDPDASYRAVVIKREFTASTVTRIVITYDMTKGSYSIPTSRALFFSDGVFSQSEADFYGIAFNTISEGVGLESEWNGSRAMSRLNVFLRSSQDNSAPYTYSGDCKITSIRLEGTGTNPFGADNCPPEGGV